MMSFKPSGLPSCIIVRHIKTRYSTELGKQEVFVTARYHQTIGPSTKSYQIQALWISCNQVICREDRNFDFSMDIIIRTVWLSETMLETLKSTQK